MKIANRLLAMKNEQKRNGRPEMNEPALVVLNRNSKEQKAALIYMNEKYPRRKSSRRRATSGVGYADGRSKAEAVGLHKQTGESKRTLSLTGN